MSAVGVAGHVLRSTLILRWRALVGLAVLLGLLGGLSLFTLAGARATQASYPAFLRSARASSIAMTNGEYNHQVAATMARLPQVIHSSTYVSFSLVMAKGGRPDFSQNPEFTGTFDGRYFTQDRFTPLTGRMPTRIDEVAVNELAATKFGYHLGQHLQFAAYPQSELAGPTFYAHPPAPARLFEARVVGIGLFPDEVVQDDGDRSTRILVSQTFTRAAAPFVTYGVLGLVLAHGDADVQAVERRYTALSPPGTATFRVTSDDVFHAQRAIQPLVTALVAFGLVVALAAVILVAQAASRFVRADRDDWAVLRALGAGPRTIAASVVLAPLLALLAGIVMAVAVAYAASPTMPIGPVARVQPSTDPHFDVTVLLGGGLLLFAVLSVVLGLTAFSELPHRRLRRMQAPASNSRIVRGAGALALPAPAMMGLRFALEPADAASQGSERSMIVGAIVALASLAAALTFGSSLGSLVNHPRWYGWNWSVAMVDGQGYGNFDRVAVGALLDRDPAVQTWSGAYFGYDLVDRTEVPLFGIDPHAPVRLPVVAGRDARNASEILLGAATADRIHKHIGDHLTLVSDDGPHIVRIVGTTIFPALGIVHGAHTSLGVGALVDPKLVPGSDRDITNTRLGSFGPNAVLVRFRSGTDAANAQAVLARKADSVADFAGAQVVSVQRPAEIVNSTSLRSAPLLLAGVLALGTTLSLALALSSSVRRRRHDLTVLKALGATRGQLSATVAWQSSSIIVVSLVVGLPAGVLIGHWLWRLFAGELQVVPFATIPWAVVIVTAVAAVMLANAVAVVPARRASRLRAATLLRQE